MIRTTTAFECAWETLRPAPKVTIDFGDGRVLDRTLAGNIATWFVTPEGEAIDVVPGLVDPVEYRARLLRASSLASQLAQDDPVERRRQVVEYHALLLGQRGLSFFLDVPLPPAAGAAPMPLGSPNMDTWISTGASAAAAWQLAGPGVIEFDTIAIGKGMLEDPLKRALREANRARKALTGRTLGLLDPLQALVADSHYTNTLRDPVVRQRFRALQELVSPQELQGWLFAEVLDIDLDDPWLGLAPYVLGSELGRDH